MYRQNASGQFVYFSMVSLASGLPITSIASGNISGRVAIDGAALGVCGGPIIEDGGGLYHLNGFAADFNGRNLGFLFTASGAAVVALTATTTGGVSGGLFLSSGQAVSLNSGQSVLVYSGQLSGQVVTAASGQVWLGSGGVAAISLGVIQRNLSGLEADMAKQSLGAGALKLTAGFNATSGITTQCDGSTIFMTQTPTYGSGMLPIRALGVGA